MTRFFRSLPAIVLACCVLYGCSSGNDTARDRNTRPNFLFILSDDQSWEHTSFAGYPLVATPNFDRIAAEGLYFTNAYASAPTCTASRSSILAGQPIWRLGSAANLHGGYSTKMISYQQLLGQAGYALGYTGKGWEPGYVPPDTPPPTGRAYNDILREVPDNLGAVDLAANFAAFLDRLGDRAPFSFWVGSVEPHRPFDGRAPGRFKHRGDLRYLPQVMPDTRPAKREFSAYLREIEVFDRDVGRLLAVLEERGLLERTVVVITSDNGMAFPRAKANDYEYGVRVPLAIRWGGMVQPGRIVDDFTSLTDIAPTFLELAGEPIPAAMTGTSLAYALRSEQGGVINPARDAAFTAFERHAGYIRGGDENLTYPRRAIHTDRYAYIHNYFPDRWPAGDPPEFIEAYIHLLRAEATGEPVQPFFVLATGKRPAEELYDLQVDPWQQRNLAYEPGYADVRRSLAARLHEELAHTGDPLELTGEDVFQKYRYWYHR